MNAKENTFWLAVFVPTLLLGLYALGVGPALRYSVTTSWRDTVQSIYQPILALDHTPLQPALWSYLRLWGSYPAGRPQPPPPVRDADPSRRHFVSIRVPTGLHVTAESERFHLTFTGFETNHLTVGYKMVTGISEETDFRREGRDAGTTTTGFYGGPLPPEIPPPDAGEPTNDIPVEYRITIFETDQPPWHHVQPTEGKYYRVLWSRTFKAPFQ